MFQQILPEKLKEKIHITIPQTKYLKHKQMILSHNSISGTLEIACKQFLFCFILRVFTQITVT